MGRLVTLLAGILVVAGFAQAQEEDTLRITEPVGGEIYYTNRVQLVTIRWEGVDDTTSIGLEWSLDGSNWNTITDSARFLSHIWDISNLPVATTYRLRATLDRPPTGADNIVYDGHGFPVYDAAWSPDGKRVVSTSIEPHIWDPEVGGNTPLATLQAPFADIYSVEWSADSSRIVIGSDNNAAISFETATNQVETTIDHPDGVPKVMLADDSQTLVTQCDDDRARAFALPSDAPTGTYNPAAVILDVELSKQADRVLVCSDQARVYRLTGGLPVIFRGHTSGVITGDWHPDGSQIVTAGGDAIVRSWNPTNAADGWTASDDREGIRSLKFSPDGSMVATGMSDSTAVIWDAETGDRLHTVSGHSEAVRVLAWSPQSDLLATGSDDNSVKIFDIERNRVLVSLAHTDNVTSAEWDVDGNRLLTTSTDRTARVWRIRSVIIQRDTTETFSIADPPTAFARFAANGDTLPIGEETTITVRLEGASDIELSDVDSVRISLRYNGTILHRQSSSLGIASERDSADQILLTMNALELPFTDQDLFSMRFRATLGTDTATALTITRVEQIGAAGIRVETQQDPIVITGHCEESGETRLYIPSGSLLSVRQVSDPSSSIVAITLAESAPTKLFFYDMSGRLLWQDDASTAEIQSRVFSRTLPPTVSNGIGYFVVVTPTDVVSTLVGGLR